MSNLSIKFQGKRGGNAQYKENIGFCTTFLRHCNDYIVVDDFEGYGDTYKKRESTEIRIYENGKLIFKGDKFEFFNKLKK